MNKWHHQTKLLIKLLLWLTFFSLTNFNMAPTSNNHWLSTSPVQWKRDMKKFFYLPYSSPNLYSLTFSATEIIIPYILFKVTLIPTLIIITQWGDQTEWIKAGLYFLFYTLFASLPLLVTLIYLQNLLGSLNFLLFNYNNTLILTIWPRNMSSMHNSIYS